MIVEVLRRIARWIVPGFVIQALVACDTVVYHGTSLLELPSDPDPFREPHHGPPQ